MNLNIRIDEFSIILSQLVQICTKLEGRTWNWKELSVVSCHLIY